MRSASVSAVNAGAFEAVTFQGMKALGENLGLSNQQVQGLYEQFSAQFREMTSPIPNLDLPTRALAVAHVSNDNLHAGNLPNARGQGGPQIG